MTNLVSTAHTSPVVGVDAVERRRTRLRELEEKMRSDLPHTLLELRRLTQSLIAAPAGARDGHQRDLEQAAHRLRGRAATLQLPALCIAAANMERLSMISTTAESLDIALAQCERALAEPHAP